MKKSGWILSFVALALLPSCSGWWDEDNGYYSEWATSFFFGNSFGDISTFHLDIKEGYTWDEEELNSGCEIYLELKCPPVESRQLPSGQYMVSDNPEQFYTVQKSRYIHSVSSYIGLLDDGEEKMRIKAIESGVVRIDRTGDDEYSVKIDVIAAGGHYNYTYRGYIWAVDCTNGGQ